jgi:hypothetical protein
MASQHVQSVTEISLSMVNRHNSLTCRGETIVAQPDIEKLSEICVVLLYSVRSSGAQEPVPHAPSSAAVVTFLSSLDPAVKWRADELLGLSLPASHLACKSGG